jgi:dihydrodipicolinate synthase/N-acetylneuraminate lyase
VALVEQLAAEMSRATAAGDLEAARVAHEMIGRLLALLASGGGAAIVDLATERDRRGR